MSSIHVFLSVDFDADSAERYYYPHSLVKISKAQFGLNVGLERLLNLLQKYNLKVTFFIPGWVAENYPDRVFEIVQDGHEIALHGYRHEKLDELSYREEVYVLETGYNILSSFGKVYGFRRPYWEVTENTFSILERMGILYDSSLIDSDVPHELELDGGKIVELPVADYLDDWILFEIERMNPSYVFDMWKDEYDSLCQMGVSYFSLVVHPACIGRASRLLMLERLIRHILDTGGVFERGIDIVRVFREGESL